MENNMTEKVMSVISKSQEIAKENFSCEIDVPHLIKALLDDQDSMLKNILGKINSNVSFFKDVVDGFISSKAKSQSINNMYLSTDFNNLLKNAENYKKAYGDSFISVEHLILAIFDTRHSILNKLLSVPNFNKVNVKKAIEEIRGGNKVVDQNPEEKYEVLKKYGRNLTEEVAKGKIDPLIGRD